MHTLPRDYMWPVQVRSFVSRCCVTIQVHTRQPIEVFPIKNNCSYSQEAFSLHNVDMQMNTNEARTYGDFKADKKRKFPELFSSSSDDSDCENLTAADRISPQKANSTLKKLS